MPNSHDTILSRGRTWNRARALLAAVGTALVSSAADAQDWKRTAKLIACDTVQAGASVSLDGNIAMLGAPRDSRNGTFAGAAHVFHRDGDGWTLVATLTAPGGGYEDYLGGSVAIEDGVAVAGVRYDDDQGFDAGAVHVFELVGGVWTHSAKLFASDGTANDGFGKSVATDGQTIMISSYDRGDPEGRGAVYVFERVADSWIETVKLKAHDSVPLDSFGYAMAIEGETAVSGAILDSDAGEFAGSVYILERVGGSWTITEKLLAADGAAGDLFGSAVGLDGETVVVGAWGDDDAGSAYVFKRGDTGWAETAKLVPWGGASDDRFGGAVAVNGGTAVVGAAGDDDRGEGSGAAYVFELGPGGWAESAKLTASDGAENEGLGIACAMDGETILLGAVGDDNRGTFGPGSGYVFEPAAPGPGQRAAGPGAIVAWGDNRFGQCEVPEPNGGFTAVAAGDFHSVGLRSDGSVVTWGIIDAICAGVPEPNEGFIEIAAGGNLSLGLKDDGSIVAWGDCDGGLCDVPEPNERFMAIATSGSHSLGLKLDGSIVAWGDNWEGELDVPEPNEGFIAVAAAPYLSLGIKQDGSLVAWGHSYEVDGLDGSYEQVDPANIGGYCDWWCYYYYQVLALREDGVIEILNSPGDVPQPNADFTAVAAGSGGYSWNSNSFSLALKSWGEVVAWGYNDYGQIHIPEPNEDFTAIAAGALHGVGLMALCVAEFNGDGTVNTQDVLVFLNAWAAGDSSADCDGDGTVNTQDLLCFLSAWNIGC